jgi:ADP-ribose pyrophosphatase YjhB (NUDIX family)
MSNLQSCVKIVLNLVFNEEEQVVLIQEAKDHSRGQWFLPAGKIKEGESILEGLKRETLEEAGIEIEPQKLMKVEHILNRGFTIDFPQYFDVFRFIVISKPLSTELKSNETKDSIQAKWFTIDEILNGKLELRSYEVVTILEFYLKHKKEIEKSIDFNEFYESIR